MGPGVDDCGIVDDADALLAVNGIGVDGVGLAQLLAGGILAEVQDGLRVLVVNIILGQGGVAVGIRVIEEPLVVLTGDNAHIPGAVYIDKGAIIVGVGSVGAVQQNGSDQGSFGEVIQSNRHVAGHTAQGVTGNADAGGVHEGHFCQFLDGLVQAHQCGAEAIHVIGIAVGGHILRQNYEAPAGQLHKVQILHALVVEHTMAHNHSRGGILRSGGVRNEQPAVHAVAVVRHPVDLLNGDIAKVGLNQAGKNAAQQHQNNTDCQKDGAFIVFSHFSFPSIPNTLRQDAQFSCQMQFKLTTFEQRSQ